MEGKNQIKNPKIYMAVMLMGIFGAIIKSDRFVALIGLVGLGALVIYSDYKKGAHTYWYRQKYKTKIEGLEVVKDERTDKAANNKDRQQGTDNKESNNRGQ